ncbi:3-oxo-23,24-bisnorchol-4,17(20)-dien-22-oyl-CoA hydratase subunit beta ChsH1 [Nonomuraea antimicrobica]|uniref:3-oxo-23,24-bisnorchol-4,17(20)-dien-22-oyl-CoA hydratase subunit beta ChsH1 n=1 Tax=Nonomuraea antimicrobica TaxID=561173 RepID=A0ABP7C6V0_9ACTN
MIGAALPELAVDLTPTVVVSTALATMDFTPVHHDTALARAQGSKDIFLNILTTMGLVERYVTDWAGPRAVIKSINVKLGVPAYAGDRLTFSGTVVSHDPGARGDRLTVEVRGRVSLGDHATATVTFVQGEDQCVRP